MILNKITKVLIFILICIVFEAKAQVQNVNYHIRFNPSTCLFDCCLIVNAGQAGTAIQRIQFSSQYSIVVPTGSSVDLVANHNPIQSNQNYTGTQPCVWFLSSMVTNPAALPGSDIMSITPSLSPSSFYNNIAAGDTVVLFSLSITPVVNCASGIRLFDNLTDPDSGAPGMGGGDFSNGFTIGSLAQKYAANSPSVFPAKPTINSITTSCSSGLQVNLAASTIACQSSLTYNWVGPDGYQSNNKDVNIQNASIYNNGQYNVTVTDKFGCKSTANIQAYAKPNAGADQVVSCFSSGSATIAAEGTGIWSLATNNPGMAVIQNVNSATTIVSGFTGSGIYKLVWSSNNCSDTAQITVGNNCNCNFQNTLLIPNQQAFCENAPSILLDGNTVTGVAGNYRWLYKLNNQPFALAPGGNTNEDYNTQVLGSGIHYFRRVFNKSSAPTCSDTSNIVTISVNTKPNAGSDKLLNCITADTAFVVTTSPGAWYIGQGSAGTATLSNISGLSTKVYDFSNVGLYQLIRTDGACNDTAIITVNNLCGCDFADAGKDRSKCAGDTLNLQSICSVGMWTALPTNPSGATMAPVVNGHSTVQFSDMAYGEFKFALSVLNLYFDTVKITVFTKPTISLGDDFGFCEGGSAVVVTASGGISYLWSTGQTTNSINIAPTVSTQYHVTGTDNHGCKNKDTLQVTIYAKPNGSIPAIPPVYEYDPLQVNAGNWTNAMIYEWSGPSGFSSSSPNNMIPSAEMNNAGTYSLMVRSPNECTATSSIQVEVLQRPLPIVLLSFDGAYNHQFKTVNLFWETGREVNSDYFIVERSVNNNTFEPIAKIASNGHSVVQQSYRFEDKDIKNNQSYFYRLKQVDLDNQYQYSKILPIVTDNIEEPNIYVYPNPVKDVLYLHASEAIYGPVSVEIFSSTGARLIKQQFDEGINDRVNIDRWNISACANGLYYIKVVSGYTDKYFKITVAN